MYDKKLKKIGIQIKTFRLQKDLSVEKLAEKADISVKYLYEIESGKKNFSIMIFMKLIVALEILPNDILMKI